MHGDDARFELAIAVMTTALRKINWPELAGDPNCNHGSNSPYIRMPMAYAMFRILVESIGDDKKDWNKFLFEALNEVIFIYGDENDRQP